jgi:quercetin dioxygenase-like cupin family protein
MNRRTYMATLAALLSQIAEAEAADSASHVTTLMHRDAPDISLDGASITVAEVAYPPGGASERHRHGGFVVAYVLEGAIRSQVSGEAERTYTKGQVFYEPPGGIHAVSRNASQTEPARLLAVLVTLKGQPVTEPA